ncbi:sugar transferase [Acidisphaera sp. L21]|uniref:sugar transferase n=1 Tax=Acidisphaera sp. L21 TaxID=1641851 RepID=UPI0020B1162E|nr:sugar transferase [Acidisphaera sp. L21]
MLDHIIAAVVLILIFPLLFVVSLLVCMDGGPVIFGHRRVGLGGQPFRCLKFRTMVMDSAAVLARTLAEDPDAAAEWAENHKLRNDPRVTRVGRFLRVTSLDELPQLFNVLRGEMSLVGPRPIVQEEVVRYGQDIEYYYRVKPGLTGLWQVSGRSDTSYRERVAFDVAYVKKWSLWQDLWILVKTVQVIVMREGSV